MYMYLNAYSTNSLCISRPLLIHQSLPHSPLLLLHTTLPIVSKQVNKVEGVCE